jgi:glycosyltransferase involved in cell wall biosynthesis
MQQLLATLISKAALPLSGKHAVAVVYSTYPNDPRVRREAEALVEAGAKVEVICLQETDDEPRREIFNNVDITRIPLKRDRGGKLSYVMRYGTFILLAGAVLTDRTIRGRRPDVVHVHNMPDILVFSALVPKIRGAKIILDLHDPMPELMETIFELPKTSFLVWLLKKLETWSILFADAVVTTNEAMRRLFSNRSGLPQKITVVMNSPDEKIFGRPERSEPTSRACEESSKKFVVMYHGTAVERNGLDLAIAALEKVGKAIPNMEFRIYGAATPFLERVLARARNSGLREVVRYMGPQSLEQISKAINECDVGIIPNPRNPFTEVNTPTRIFEYLSQGKPVIAPKTPGILDYFGSAELLLFEQDDTDDLAAKLTYAFRYPTELAKIVTFGEQVCRKYPWSSQRSRFVSVVQELLRKRESSPACNRSLAATPERAGKRLVR